jgi:hypothetical protein
VPGVCGIDPNSPGFATGFAGLAAARQPFVAVPFPPRPIGKVVG